MATRPFRNWRRAADHAADLHIALMRLPKRGKLLTAEQIEVLLRHAVVAGFDAGLKWRAAGEAPAP